VPPPTDRPSPQCADVATELQAWAEDVRARELERLGHPLLDQVTRSVVDAVIDPVVRRLQRAADEDDAALLHAARELFGLPPAGPLTAGSWHTRRVPKISAATLDEHRRDMRDRLFDAWGALTAERGYEAVTLADVAAQAGLARSAIYNYFADKEALLFAYTDREIARFLATLADAFDGVTSAFGRLRIYIELQFADFASRPPPPGRELAAVLAPDVYERFLGHIEPAERIVRGLVAEGVVAGEFIDLDPDDTALLIMGCVGAERLPLGAGRHDPAQTVERVVAFIGRALGVSATG
jgi:AcrR family transcriptional regulator